MKIFAKKILATVLSSLTISIALSSTASATNLNAVNFTANGKTSVKNALLFKQLMGNRSNLSKVSNVTVTTKLLPRKTATQAIKNVGVSYTITGKTSLKKAKKLIQLFQNSKKIEIVTKISQASERYAKGVNYYRPIYYTSVIYPQFNYYQTMYQAKFKAKYQTTYQPAYQPIYQTLPNTYYSWIPAYPNYIALNKLTDKDAS